MEEIFLWEKYDIYSYDEDDESDYVGDFMEELNRKDPDKATEIFQDFFEKIKNGIGVPVDWSHSGKKLKKLQENLWEYRDRSPKIRCLIRIYFGIDEKNRKIILLDGQLKHDNKDQRRKIETVEKRWNAYKKKGEI